MNFNASIVDQQLSGLMEQHPDWLPPGDANKQRSAAFVILCMTHFLEVSQEEAAEWLTEGGNDAGVDGLHIGDVVDSTFVVTIFQAKYKVNKLDGAANFPETGVQQAVQTVEVLFDPSRTLTLNDRITPMVEEIRSLIRDGFIPKIRIVLCNNGARWNTIAQGWIDAITTQYPEKIECFHYNHDRIVQALQKTDTVDIRLQLSGEKIVEDMNYMRVLIGRVAVRQIADLFEEHGDRLLQRNIRRFLGLYGNRVNEAIHATLQSEKADQFYFYNNGLTLVCDKFDYNAFQKSDHLVQLKNVQIINGGQTCKTIHQTLKHAKDKTLWQSTYVLVRIYQVSEQNQAFVQDITVATNSQNPVDLRDLKSNDPLQKQLEIAIADLGYTYKRQRQSNGVTPQTLTSTVVAESVLAIWLERPQQAKSRREEHFGKLYLDIFQQLNAAQAILAVLIFRAVENARKRPQGSAPDFLPYASHYLAMLIGRYLLAAKSLDLEQVNHRNFEDLRNQLQATFSDFYAKALQEIETGLVACYGQRAISLQQLSATFRRGDLLEMLTG